MRTAFGILLLVSAASAQTHLHGPEPVEAPTDLGKLPAPRHIDGIGHSHIGITTKSAEAQQWFDQGLATLHCFWYYEALRAFEQALRLDPDCAMCHWGISRALDFQGRDEQAKQEIRAAQNLAAKTSDREQRYIRAYFDFEEKSGDDATHAFNQQMESLIDHYPDDVEAKLLYALSLMAGYDAKGEPRPGAAYSQTILRELLWEYPENAAANHYWIHLIESSGHPEWALESAQKLARLAPASGHMVHMPGHIFYRTGNYEKAHQAFLDSLRVDREYMKTQGVSAEDNWNYEHNLSYLIATCAEEGRLQEGREYARELQGLIKDPGPPARFNFNVLQIASTASRLSIRFARWDDAIAHPIHFDVPDAELSLATRAYRDGLVEYAQGMKSAESGQLADAESHSGQLDAMLWRISQEHLKGDVMHARDRVAKILGTASLELRGNIAGRRNDWDAARSLLEQAQQSEVEIGYAEPPRYARPALEVLGDLLIRAGKFDESREAYRKVLDERPHSGWALFGIAVAWQKQGKGPEAAKAFHEFLDAWSHADQDLPEIKTAQAYLANAAPSSTAP